MKKLLLAGASLVILCSAASAADLAARPYMKAPIVSPAYNWSGFYIGAMGGYGWSDSQGLDMTGGFGGGTVGYNWQWDHIVAGIEAEAAGGDISQSATGLGITVETKVRAFGSITGRIGYAANNWLFYGKGGYGWVDNRISLTSGGATLADTQTHNGYVVGGGIEYGFTPNWSIKGEYLLYHADSKDYFGGLPSGDFDIQTVKLGVNYHFGWGGPAIARY
jgi:outer membrane immunogenic protein